MKKFDKYLGKGEPLDPKAYFKQRLMRHEFMLRRARERCVKEEVLRIIHAVTRELRYIYRDLFTDENDEEGDHKIEV